MILRIINKLCFWSTSYIYLTLILMEVIMKKILIIFTFLITTLLLTACDKKSPPPPKPPIEVSVMKIIAQDTPIDFEYVGQTLSPNEVELRARVAGFLDKQL